MSMGAEAPGGAAAEPEEVAGPGLTADFLSVGYQAAATMVELFADLPPDRVDVSAYYDKEKTTPDKIYCTRGGFIPKFDFEPREFGLNMFQMEDTDANQTLSLLKVKEALENANIDPSASKRKNIGCVLGNVGGSKASHEFYSRLNYVVVEKARGARRA